VSAYVTPSRLQACVLIARKSWRAFKKESSMSKKKRAGGTKRIVDKADPGVDGLPKKMLDHFIPYEIGMLRALHKLLKMGFRSKLERNAAIEAFHIHARNLMEFFQNDKQCAIAPHVFTDNNYCVDGTFISKKLKTKISQQIVHLTHERTDVDADKLSDDERDKTVDAIEKQIERFEKALTAGWLPVWREGLNKMNFDTPQNAPDMSFAYRSGPTGPAGPGPLDAARHK
jgi:hypothetical protein